jgi:hypothetical protein
MNDDFSEGVTRAQGEPATRLWSSVEHTLSETLIVGIKIAEDSAPHDHVTSFKDVNAACTRWLLAHGCLDDDFKFTR